MNKSISVIGCGWLGLPLASELMAQGFRVKGTTTNEKKLSLLQKKGISASVLKLPAAQKDVGEDLFNSEVLIFNIPPGLRNGDESEYIEKIESFLSLIKKSMFRKLIHISTTSIYSITKDLCVENDADRSCIHFLVEQKLSNFCLENEKHFISARCGGLMGYDRFPCKYYSADSVVKNGENGVNYIHRDDLINILILISSNNKLFGPVNLCAPMHPRRVEIIKKCAEEAVMAIPIFETQSGVGKIVSTELFEKVVNYNFKYPNPLDFYYEFKK